jgi:hypothetical protein
MTRHKRPMASTATAAPIGLAEIVAVLKSLVDADATISGATVFMPDGDVRYIDADTLWQGGAA